MKNLTRKTAFGIIALIAAAGVVAIPVSAEADTGWGWRVIPSHHQAK
ncbi:hypothetical protein [Nocardioides humi]|nr:hypothetical protein [Nocardioides humi]